MKKVVLLLPDEMCSVKGTTRLSKKETVPTTQENLIKALTLDDYHMNLFFENEGKIEVLSIEDLKEE